MSGPDGIAQLGQALGLLEAFSSPYRARLRDRSWILLGVLIVLGVTGLMLSVLLIPAGRHTADPQDAVIIGVVGTAIWCALLVGVILVPSRHGGGTYITRTRRADREEGRRVTRRDVTAAAVGLLV